MRKNHEAARRPEDAVRLQEIFTSDGFRDGDPEAVESFWRVYFKPYFPDQSLVSRLDLKFTENTIENWGRVAELLLGSVGEFDLRADLRLIHCPTLVIHGGADPLPVKCAELIHDRIPGSELVVVEGAGHWLFVDGTEVFTSTIVDFLAAHREG
jgi:pimeloyl-ACP methyl ester carboxylesterase